MFLKRLQLKNFRNYKDCDIEFDSNKTIFIGKNAQGKTNLLEAVYFLSTLSSDRAANDSELILWGENFSVLKGELYKNETDVDLEVIINPPKKKIIKLNEVKKSKYSEFVGVLMSVKFGVSDLLLLRGSPGDRRKWLDDSISQIYPAYSDRISKFNKIRTQRNNLLKEFYGNINLSQTQKDTLGIWNDQLVITGANIIYLRQKFLKEIQKFAFLKHKEISEDEKLLITYNSTVSGDFNTEGDDIYTAEQIAELFLEKLVEKQNEEVIRAQTLVGPHRDDISFFINDIDSKSYASQGQQRTIVLSLKLAELEFINSKTGLNPILLLDDVLAELDSNRQNYLLSSIGYKIQTIITSTDVKGFSPEFLEGVKIYTVSDGSVIY